LETETPPFPTARQEWIAVSHGPIPAGDLDLSREEMGVSRVTAKSLSSRALTRRGKRVPVWFSLLFMLVGGGFFAGLFVWPALKVAQAKGWVETPCVVESSRLQSHRSKNGRTYSIEIQYRYTFNGHEYHSDRYHFLKISTSGRSGKQAILRRYPPGAKTICYVNPQDASEAVLERGVTRDMWLGLFPLVFVLVGMLTLVYGRGKKRPGDMLSPSANQGEMGAGLRPASFSAGPVELKPTQSSWGKLIAVLFISIFWNGVLSVFVWQAIKGWRDPHGSFMFKWFLPVFLIPFLLIGLGLIFGVFYCFLAFFNPRPRLKVNSRALALGQTLEVEWRMEGRVQALRRMHLFLEGREEVSYRRGTRTYSDKNVFSKLDLARVSTLTDMRSGRSRLTLPADTVPSFEASSNKIVWALKVEGEIPLWPDVREEFLLNLKPAANQLEPAAPDASA
jgi:Protein of unknown function (DUF3592)